MKVISLHVEGKKQVWCFAFKELILLNHELRIALEFINFSFIFPFSSYKTECPAEIYLSVDRNKNKLIIRRMVTEHNHLVSREVFQRYQEQRCLSKEMEEKVKTWFKQGLTNKEIYSYIMNEVTYMA